LALQRGDVAQDRGASRYRRISATRPHKAAAPGRPPDASAPVEGAARYEQTIDPASDSTHARVVRLVGEGKRVLELGCSTGFMSRVLRERGCHVTAVEQDADAAEKARPFCERVIVGDVEQLDLGRALGKARFDVILAADVLEHLKEPLGLLRSLKRFLADDGWLVASLPNVAHGSVRLALLGGQFRYNSMGLLDRTHLRFFTRDGVQKLFDDAGFLIGHLERHEMRIEDSEVSFDPAAVPSAVMEALTRDREALTYQFIVVAHALPRERVDFIQELVRSSAAAQEVAEARSARLAEEKQVLEGAARELAAARDAAEAGAQRTARESEVRQRRLEEMETRLTAAEASFAERALEMTREVERAREQAQRDREASARVSAAARADVDRLRLVLQEKLAQLDALAERARQREDREAEARGLLQEAHAQLRARDEELARRRGLEADLAAHQGAVASWREQHAEALARMAGMRRTRVWRVGTVYWWIEARLKSLLRL
jgi:2-polyprenyl-3-methyl-5-hydroxy-6-metoxy-1,4-benzoquinol methylase